jgi:hypothetical protein
VTERNLYAYSRVEQPRGSSETFKRGGEVEEGTNFIHWREKGGIIVELGWRSDYVHAYVRLAQRKHALPLVYGSILK